MYAFAPVPADTAESEDEFEAVLEPSREEGRSRTMEAGDGGMSVSVMRWVFGVIVFLADGWRLNIADSFFADFEMSFFDESKVYALSDGDQGCEPF
jgi:hypothetical protein